MFFFFKNSCMHSKTYLRSDHVLSELLCLLCVASMFKSHQWVLTWWLKTWHVIHGYLWTSQASGPTTCCPNLGSANGENITILWRTVVFHVSEHLPFLSSLPTATLLSWLVPEHASRLKLAPNFSRSYSLNSHAIKAFMLYNTSSKAHLCYF